MKKIFSTCLGLILCFSPAMAFSQESSGMALERNTAYVGLLLNYSNNTKENTKALLENVKYAKSISTSIRMGGGYFIKKNFSLGLGVTLGKEKEDKEVINTFGPNTISSTDLNVYSFAPFMRNYFQVGKSQRFYLFSQTSLQFGMGNGEETAQTGNTITNTDVKKINYGIGFTPGITFLVQKGFAFEVSVGVLGLDHSKEERTTKGQDPSINTTTNVDLSINLLKLNLGLAYYF